jgi:hypothetical protein
LDRTAVGPQTLNCSHELAIPLFQTDVVCPLNSETFYNQIYMCLYGKRLNFCLLSVNAVRGSYTPPLCNPDPMHSELQEHTCKCCISGIYISSLHPRGLELSMFAMRIWRCIDYLYLHLESFLTICCTARLGQQLRHSEGMLNLEHIPDVITLGHQITLGYCPVVHLEQAIQSWNLRAMGSSELCCKW